MRRWAFTALTDRVLPSQKLRRRPSSCSFLRLHRAADQPASWKTLLSHLLRITLLGLSSNQPLRLWVWSDFRLWHLAVSQSSTESGWCWQFLLIRTADTCKQVHFYFGTTGIFRLDVMPPVYTPRGRKTERVTGPTVPKGAVTTRRVKSPLAEVRESSASLTPACSEPQFLHLETRD